jgi:serine/threonine protein kinase
MDHPSIVKFYQVIYDNKYINIVMELVNGIPLSDFLIKHGKIDEKKC